jgi:hypothetical protein
MYPHGVLLVAETANVCRASAVLDPSEPRKNINHADTLTRKPGVSSCEQAWWWGGAGCLGDQQAAMLGQRCKPLEAKNTYGTGCFVLLNTGTAPIQSSHGLLTTMVRPLCSIWPFARPW